MRSFGLRPQDDEENLIIIYLTKGNPICHSERSEESHAFIMNFSPDVFGRALGETMAVTFLAGNVNQIPKSLLDPFTTITVALANQFTEADTAVYLSSLYYLALILFVISFAVLYLSKIMLLRLEKKWKV